MCRRLSVQGMVGLLASVTFVTAAISQAPPALAQTVVRFDFTQARDAESWRPVHDVARLESTAEGLLIAISGDDPYVHGSACDYPPGQPLWLNLRLKSTSAGTAQVFYFSAPQGAREADSVRFPVRSGRWETCRVPLPPLGPGYSLRFDPPGGAGDQTVLATLAVEIRPQLEEPEWPAPAPLAVQEGALSVKSGDVELFHNPDQWNGFAVRVAGQPMATGFTRPLIGYLHDGAARWIDVAECGDVNTWKERDALIVQAAVSDADGADWTLRRRVAPGSVPGSLDIESQVTISRDRQVTFLPMFVALPGLGSFGEKKNQALFAGLEYLGKDEPSSSEADIIGPGSKRQVPDTLKITMPLMAIQADDRYVGLIWEKAPQFSALFDSPDRLFGSGAHVMGILFPGSNGTNRAEGSLLPYDGQLVEAGMPLTLRATVIGGRGTSVVPAIQQFVALHGLPPVPKANVNWDTYLATAAAGWLDSAICVDKRYRHAWPGNFNPQPAADAAMMMDWLSLRTNDGDLRHRLREAARTALAEVRPADLNLAAVSHVRCPAAMLVYGHTTENVSRARQAARELLKHFELDGSILYRKPASGPDFGKTHSAPDANGLTAHLVANVLQAATICGDPDLTKEGVRVLRALDKFTDTVPRGAQTWEVPLHTPDILASANLVRAYTLGYELTGDPHFLDQARYWAWTGVSFVYLAPPTEQPVGLYATIPVLGATHWIAPNWMGLPVQWCGLVYADALYRLARYDASGPWEHLADGITASGVQQTWPAGSDTERQGLLPDSFELRAEIRNNPAINPGTVLANAVRLFDQPALYDFRVFRMNNLFLHAPGAIRDATEAPARITFTIDPWPDHPYQILLAGCKGPPHVSVNGKQVALTSLHEYNRNDGMLILTLEGKSTVEIAF